MAFADIFARHETVAPGHAARFSLTQALAVWRSRRALARLDARALNDIGVSADRAAREAAKPVWDVPANWRD
ncbi:MAG: DUF1127 domain-containing protein [Pseudomonadota bacterium]